MCGRHNPLTYFSDVVNSATERLNLLPFTQFSADLANNQLPNLSFIVPNINDDAHNGILQAADTWLRTNIAPLLASAVFQQDGLLLIVFDEGVTSDTARGGGQVAMVVVSGKSKPAYKSTAVYQHENALRTVLDALGVNSYAGNAATASGMSDFFAAATPPTPTPAPVPTPARIPAPTPTPAGTISVAASPAVINVARGQSGTAAVTITPSGGFTGMVSLACSNPQAGVTCSFFAQHGRWQQRCNFNPDRQHCNTGSWTRSAFRPCFAGGRQKFRLWIFYIRIGGAFGGPPASRDLDWSSIIGNSVRDRAYRMRRHLGKDIKHAAIAITGHFLQHDHQRNQRQPTADDNAHCECSVTGREKHTPPSRRRALKRRKRIGVEFRDA